MTKLSHSSDFFVKKKKDQSDKHWPNLNTNSTDSESTFDQPKSFDYAYEDDQQTSTLDQVVNFVQTMYNLYRKWCF